jgi:ankyrin repeat-rich membrane spanning protein
MAAPEAVVAIHRAAGQGDVEGVARMLDEDPQLLSFEQDRYTLLTRATSRGHVGVVRLLLERGTGVNAPTANGSLALHGAAYRGHEEVVSLLLTNGADASRVDRSGFTALMWASHSGHAAVVRLLLRYMGGCGLDVMSGNRWTALWFACCRGDADVARGLLLAGADHTIAPSNELTPRQIAQMRHHHECVSLIEVRGPRSLMPLLILSWIAHGIVAPCIYRMETKIILPCLCCSGGRPSCSVRMSSTRPGLYTKTPPHTSKPLQPQCPPT